MSCATLARHLAILGSACLLAAPLGSPQVTWHGSWRCADHQSTTDGCQARGEVPSARSHAPLIAKYPHIVVVHRGPRYNHHPPFPNLTSVPPAFQPSIHPSTHPENGHRPAALVLTPVALPSRQRYLVLFLSFYSTAMSPAYLQPPRVVSRPYLSPVFKHSRFRSAAMGVLSLAIRARVLIPTRAPSETHGKPSVSMQQLDKA